ncbi:MAG TPA: hypothetical protein VEB18_03725 [Candidatus Paceibacterota bacterium]|nr:hypothetical protein [Candidatus Paceibacterota bacterium]
MGLFGPGKRERAIQREMEDDLLYMRAASETRKVILDKLVSYTDLVTQGIAVLHTQTVQSVQTALTTWFQDRLQPLKSAIAGRVQARLQAAQDKNLRTLMSKRADAYRQQVIKQIGAEGAEIFHKHVMSRMADLLYSIRTEYEAKRFGLTTGTEALPPGTRFLFQRPGHRRHYIIEQAPTVRAVRFGQSGYESSYRYHSLAFPYVVFLVIISENDFEAMYVFFRTKPLSTINDDLYIPALPNLSSSSLGVCTGTMLEGVDQPGPCGLRVMRAIEAFWNSGFNDHWTHFLRNYNVQEPRLASLAEWERQSKKDPNFVLSVPWIPAGKTLAGHVHHLLQGTETGNGVVMTGEEADVRVRAISERVAKDAMETAAGLIPRLPVDMIGDEVLVDILSTAIRESVAEVNTCLSESMDGLFADPPSFELVNEQAGALRAQLLAEADKKVGWTGIIAPPGYQQSQSRRAA